MYMSMYMYMAMYMFFNTPRTRPSTPSGAVVRPLVMGHPG